MISKEGVEDFFNRYASTMNNALFGDMYTIGSIMSSFADFVVGANPNGIAGGKNDAKFAEAVRSGIEFYRKIGIVSMNILDKEIFILDDFHAIVKISWSSFYNGRNDSGEIPFEAVYLVQYRDGAIKIFAYVTGDEQEAFKLHNLIGESVENQK